MTTSKVKSYQEILEAQTFSTPVVEVQGSTKMVDDVPKHQQFLYSIQATLKEEGV